MGNVLVQTFLQGPVLALLAMGMSLVFGALRFADIFQVTTATLGAYGTYVLMTAARLSVWPASAISITAVGIVCVLLYHGIFRRLLTRNPATAMIGSLALSILTQALVQTIAGPEPRDLSLPLQRGLTVLGTGTVTPYQAVAGGIGLVAVVAVISLLRFSKLGRQIRGVSSNRTLAEASGISARRIIQTVWMLSGAIGALAGVLLAIEAQVTFNMGFAIILPVFAVALLGGFGSPGGAAVGGYLLAFATAGVLQVDWGSLIGLHAGFVPTSYSPAIGFVVLLLVLAVRPEGLFGRTVRHA